MEDISWERHEGLGPLDDDQTAPPGDRAQVFWTAESKGWILTAYQGGYFYLTRPGADSPTVYGKASSLESAKERAINWADSYGGS